MSSPIFMFDAADPTMLEAHAKARATFKHLWRELSWERRRIIPALEMAAIKLPFADPGKPAGEAAVEQMWVTDVGFDGVHLTGTLLNSPNGFTSVKAGDAVKAPFGHLADWMMVSSGKAYGCFTVNLLRARMKAGERQSHDRAWGLDFGDPSDNRIEIWENKPAKTGFFARLLGQKTAPDPTEDPGRFKDHPMAVNMVPKLEELMAKDPAFATRADKRGWTMLHDEALAGNLVIVKTLIKGRADGWARTPDGRDAAALARGIGWGDVADHLEKEGK